MNAFVAIVVTVAMKGAPAYKIQFVEGACNKERAAALATEITKKANGRVTAVECIPLSRK